MLFIIKKKKTNNMHNIDLLVRQYTQHNCVNLFQTSQT